MMDERAYLVPAQHWAWSRFGLAGEAQRVAGLNIAHLGGNLSEMRRRFGRKKLMLVML